MNHRNLKVYVITIISHCAMLSVHGDMYKVADINTVGYGHRIRTVTARSSIDCYITCSKLGTCRSVTYDMTSRECYLNAEAVPARLLVCESCGNSSIVKYGIKEGACLTSMRYPCRRSAECVDQNSYCRDDVCTCKEGRHHDPNTCACATGDCTKYGDTFQVHYWRYFYHKNEWVSSDLTLAECLEMCTNNTKFTCRFAEYWSMVSNQCRLQTVTCYGQTLLTDLFTSLYTRDCVLDLELTNK